MTFWNHRITCLLLLLVSVGVNSEEYPVDIFSGGTVEYHETMELESRQVLLSAPKRVANNLRIEKSISSPGPAKVMLIRVGAPYTYKQAFSYYRDLVSKDGEILYECEERGCGSSNYWANSILNERKLYGRDSDQAYLAGRLGSANGPLISVYAVRNGRKQHYVYITVEISTGGGDLEDYSAGVFIAESELGDRLSAVKPNTFEQVSNSTLWVVCSAKDEGIDTSQLFSKSEALAEKYAEALRQASNLSPDNIKAISMGPFQVSGQQSLPAESGCYVQLRAN